MKWFKLVVLDQGWLVLSVVRHVATTAVALPLSGDNLARPKSNCEQVQVQALLPRFASETFHLAVLSQLLRVNKVHDIMGIHTRT